MNNKNTISITEGRNRIFKIAEQVQKPETHYILTQKGKPKIVVISAEEFDSWKETIEIMKEIPSLEKDAKIARKEYKEGKTISLEDFLAEKGFVRKNKK